VALHCPDCGFVNVDGANYCQRCGHFLGAGTQEHSAEPTTATYRVGETGELIPIDLDDAAAHGPVLVIRAGGGRVGESFPLDGDRMTIGRRPDSDIFLDDVNRLARPRAPGPPRRRPVPRRPRVAQRLLRQTAGASSRTGSRTATSCRSASTSWTFLQR